jgi:uncharacterized membrane protein YkvA (DUF1232 family)
MNRHADALAAAIQKLPRPVNAMLLLAAAAYTLMPWHFVPLVGQIDLAVVLWFAWKNLKALFRATESQPAAPPPQIGKGVPNVQ